MNGLANALGLGGIIGYSSLWANPPTTCPVCGVDLRNAYMAQRLREWEAMQEALTTFRDNFARPIKVERLGR